MHIPDDPSLSRFDALWNHDDPAGTDAQFRLLLAQARAGNDPSYLTELLMQIARTETLQQRFDEAESLLTMAGGRARVRYLFCAGVRDPSRRPMASAGSTGASEPACFAGTRFSLMKMLAGETCRDARTGQPGRTFMVATGFPVSGRKS